MEKPFDLVILENHTSEFLCLGGRRSQSLYKGKVIFHSHNVPAHIKPFIGKMAVTKTVLSVSNALSALWERAFPAPEVNFLTLRNGVDLDVFRPIKDAAVIRETKLAYHIPLDKKIVLFAGRMVRQKGIFALLEAMPFLPESFHLVLVGDFFYGSKAKGKEALAFEKAAKCVGNRCSFTGYVPYEKMGVIYAVADVVVLPSIGFDAAQLTCAEALCCGKPLITTNVGGIPEYVGKKTILLDAQSPSLAHNIANEVLRIASDPSRAAEMANDALSMRAELSKDLFISNFKDVLLKELGQ